MHEKDLHSSPAPFCSGRDEVCSYTHCCEAAGQVCYMHTPNYATCQSAGTCTRGSCEVAPVESECASRGGECTLSGCCAEDELRCFKKDARYARCMRGCLPGVGDFVGWSCDLHERPRHDDDRASGDAWAATALTLSAAAAGLCGLGVCALRRRRAPASSSARGVLDVWRASRHGTRQFRDESDSPQMEMAIVGRSLMRSNLSIAESPTLEEEEEG